MTKLIDTLPEYEVEEDEVNEEIKNNMNIRSKQNSKRRSSWESSGYMWEQITIPINTKSTKLKE